MLYTAAERRWKRDKIAYAGRVAGDTPEQAVAMLATLWPHTSGAEISQRAGNVVRLTWPDKPGKEWRLTPIK